MSNLEINYYNQGDETNIIKLLIDSFERWPNHEPNCKPIEHWRWKYLENPTGLNNIVYMTDNSTIVGCDHTFFKTVKMGENTIIAGISGDTATHKNYRGRGIYKELAAAKKQIRKSQGGIFGYWITINPIFIEYAKKLQRPTFPHPISNMFKILDVEQYFGPTRLTEKGIKKIGYLILSKKNKSEIMEDGDLEVRLIKNFDEKADTFWSKIKNHYNFIIERDSTYLNYRYCDHRAGKYSVYALFEKNEMYGYIVLGEKQTGEKRTGIILDLLTLPNLGKGIDLLIQSAFEYYSQKGINRVFCWAIEGHPLRKALLKHGFVSLKSDVPHLYFAEEAVKELLIIQNSSPDKLHLSKGDIDEI